MNTSGKILAAMSTSSKVVRLCTLCFALLMLSACGAKEELDDVAVAKMTREQMVATSFLPLNPDNPGEYVTVERYLVPGKYTVVAFFSQYDGVSPQLIPWLNQLTQVRQDIAVRTIDVNRQGVQGIDWQSSVLNGSGITKLPYFQIYDPTQSLRAQARPAYEQVTQWVQSLQQGQAMQQGQAPVQQ